MAELPVVAFWFDVVCPYAYVAAVRLLRMEQAGELRIDWRPILLGGVLRAVGGPDRPMDAMAPSKVAHIHADLQRQARLLGLTLDYPVDHPRRTVDVMRAVVAAPAERRGALALDLWRAYWSQGDDLRDPAVLAERIAPHGLTLDDVRSAREPLRVATHAAVDAGVFGVPAMAVDGRLFWGADRLPDLRHALALPVGPAAPNEPLTVFHDFASPYSYLGVMPLLGRPGVTLRPMLLGALFKTIGTPVVPVATFGASKAAWVRRDLAAVAARRGLRFRFSPHFPVRTVTALRIALVEPATTGPLYEAVWADGRDIGRTEVLGDVLTDAGFDAAALLDAAQAGGIRQALRDNTAAAVRAGVPGAPTYLHRTGLYWGQDRLELIATMETHGA